MKNLTPVEEIVEIIAEYGKGRLALHCEMRERVTQDRNQAYTRLVEGIEEMKPHVRNVPPSDKQSIEAVCLVQVGYEQCKKDFLENVVKPLYGKLEL